MPLDAICLRGIIHELQPAVGLRIEKIQQPARDQVILTLRGSRKLLLNAGANQPRIHFTALSRENPAAPPMFCMLLRKHLSGGTITALEQAGLDRVVILTIRVMDEIGISGTRKLILECMSRHANLILLDGDGRIIDCLRHVDMEMSTQRQVLPGLFYHLPPVPPKRDPLSVSREDFLSLARKNGFGLDASQWLLGEFLALSPLICRELTYEALGQTGGEDFSGSPAALDRLSQVFALWQGSVKENRFTPHLVLRDGKPADFSYRPITQYGPGAGETRDTFSSLLDTFYEERERQERVRQKGQDLQKTASTARDRTARKIAAQEQELAETKNREELRVRGELITANLYHMERGMTSLRTENYYLPDSPMITIPLDPLLTPQQNAARYFKQYSKAKTAERHLTEQLAKARGELEYLNSILDELSRAEWEQDFNDIRSELRQAGYLRQQGKGKKEPRQAPSRPRQFRSSSGCTILVGRSNTQNDMLTRTADKRDIWFHTQKIHGSHVILRTNGETPDDRSLQEAAALAAWFSQGRDSSLVAVDYTAVKNVKKPSGARPGMVVYDPYQTAYVRPDPQLVKELAVK